MRLSIYFTPPPSSMLGRAASRWLGRDPFTGETTHRPEPAQAALFADPARYGFHATLKAPFRLAETAQVADVDARLAAFCAARGGVAIAHLALRRLDGFYALVPREPEAELDRLCDEVVRDFEPFRAPLDAAEIARRSPDRLSGRQRRHLAEWGYPFVFEDFRFHMTLTGRVAEAAADAVEAELETRFAPFLGRPLAVDGLALFVEPEPGAPFRVLSRHSFRNVPQTTGS